MPTHRQLYHATPGAPDPWPCLTQPRSFVRSILRTLWPASGRKTHDDDAAGGDDGEGNDHDPPPPDFFFKTLSQFAKQRDTRHSRTPPQW